MTAVCTGTKTHNGVIAQSPAAVRGTKDGEPLKSVLEYAEERGLSTGVISNSSVLSATPAACYAHVNDRKKEGEIFQQLLKPRFGDGVDVVMGAGRKKVLQAADQAALDARTALRKAGLEWYEQADAWDRVCRERPLPEGVPAERLRELSRNIRVLLLADTTSDGGVFGPDASAENVSAWARTFRSAGEQLRTSGRSGTLERGLRELVSYHVIFHWNRMGLASITQSALAHAAKMAILEPN